MNYVRVQTYGRQKIDITFLGQICKKTLGQAEKYVLSQSRYLSSKYFANKAPNHDEGSSVPFKYTVAIYTGMPKNILGATLYHDG